MSESKIPALAPSRPKTSSLFGPRYNEGNTDHVPIRASKYTLLGCCLSVPMAVCVCFGLFFVLALHGCYANDLEEKLFNAAGDGDKATAERLVNMGADIDGKHTEFYPGETPLKNAVRGQRYETVKFLLDHHANPSGTLHLASDPDIVRLLKAAGATE